MNRTSIRHAASCLILTTAAIASTGCAGTTEPSLSPVASVGSAKAALPAPSVSGASPSFGHEGEVNKVVTITGSGFVPGAQAAWERNGVADPKIQVTATTYVSSTQLSATITIAADADLTLYDISVTEVDRKKGIGYSLFEVTTAVALSGTEIAYGVNSNGEIAGRVGVPGAFYYSQATGVVTLGSPGRAYGISGDGKTVAGGTTNNALNAQAYLYVNVAGVWQKTTLPKDPASCIATARAIGSDVSGAAVFVGGVENGGCYNQSNLRRQPRIWVPVGGTWTKQVLPGATNSDDMLDDVNGQGIAVGTVGSKAAVWTPNGTGSWIVTQIGATGSALHGIRNDGTIAVGETSGVAQYWTSTGGAWSGPFPLPGGCSSAVSVDNVGNILANGCANGNRRTPGVISPPYTSVRVLGGLGGGTSGTITAERISGSGGWVVGQATLQSTGVGVYWKIF